MTRSPTSKQLGFAEWLAGLEEKQDRATLAALRRGLMLDEEHLYELFGHIPPSFLTGLPRGEERLYLMVAALFGYHPASFRPEDQQERRRNLGESLRELALRKAKAAAGDAQEGDEPGDSLPDSLKRRVEGLLSAHREDLFGHLRQIISLLKAEEIPVDWAQLLSDLQAWDWQGRPVQWQWSRSFYVGHQDKGGNDTDVR